MEKAKRKEQLYNARRYWIIFSVLTVLLLIPFRIVGYWGLTYNIYAVISVVMLGVLVCFVWRYSWRKKLTTMLMIACFLLPIAQMSIMRIEIRDNCTTSSNGLIETYQCGNTVCGGGIVSVYVGVRNMPVVLFVNNQHAVFVYFLC